MGGMGEGSPLHPDKSSFSCFLISTIMQTSRLLSLAAFSSFVLASCQSTPPAPDRFALADTNKDAVLSGREINHFFVANIFTERDPNQNGFITQAEWNPQMIAGEAKLFGARDANEDGKISLAEAEAYALKAGTYTSVIKEADTTKDGAISREEANAYYGSKEGPVR